MYGDGERGKRSERQINITSVRGEFSQRLSWTKTHKHIIAHTQSVSSYLTTIVQLCGYQLFAIKKYNKVQHSNLLRNLLRFLDRLPGCIQTKSGTAAISVGLCGSVGRDTSLLAFGFWFSTLEQQLFLQCLLHPSFRCLLPCWCIPFDPQRCLRHQAT